MTDTTSKGSGGDAQPRPDITTIALPFGLELAEFKPGVVYIESLHLTQMLLEDVPTVWRPWRGTADMGHAVDLGYHAETGELVGIQIWDDVRTRPA